MSRMAEAPAIITAEQLLALPRDGQRYELLHGRVHRMTPPGARHGAIAMRFGQRLASHVEEHRLGEVLSDAGFLLESDPDLVRAPDVAFLQRERIPEGGLPAGYWPGAPDLAIEVVSPHDRYVEVMAKTADWLRSGCRMVVVVEPERHRLLVHRATKEVQVLTDDDVIDGGEVVPQFRLRVGDLFR